MSSLNDNIVVLKSCIANAESEIIALQSGRKASAAKARAQLQKVKTLCHTLRGDIMTYVKELPTKSRVKKVVDEPIVEKKENM